MEFTNKEVMELVVGELQSTVSDLYSDKKVRCFLNYLRLVDKCYTLESSRVNEGMKGAWHHILPRSLYPEYIDAIPPLTSNFNEVRMTQKEHFVAHHLLYEIYGRSGPMATAFKFSCLGELTRDFCTKSNLEQLGSWRYTTSDETKEKISKSKLGHKHSEKSKSKMSESQKGNQNARGSKRSEETRARLPELRTGLNHSEETRAKMSESQRGRKHSEETRSRISESNRGKKRSEEGRSRISEAMKNIPRVTCPHCGKSGSPSNIRRWHFDNCKLKPE